MSTLFLTICGAIGNIFFGLKSSFQVYENYKIKQFKCSLLMILSDFIGNICCGTYIAGTTGFWTLPWQFVNYTLATLFIFILLGQYFKYKKKETKQNFNPWNNKESITVEPMYGCIMTNADTPITSTLHYRPNIMDGVSEPGNEFLNKTVKPINTVNTNSEVLVARSQMNTFVK